MKIEDVVSNYFEFLAKELNYSKETIIDYQYDIKTLMNYLKEKKIDYLKITKEDIIAFLKELDNKGLANKSIARILSGIRSFYNYLIEIKLLDDNVFRRIKNPKVEKKLPNYLNECELEEVYDKIEEDDILSKCLFELIYTSGIRVSEASNIKIGDIDFTNLTINIVGKGSKERIVYFGSLAKELILSYLQKRALINVNNLDYLFINKYGRKMSRQSIEYVINKVSKNSKTKISPHTLRHTYATHLLNNGADIKSVQELLGHENLNTTEIYTHISNERLRAAYLKYHPNKKRQ